MTRTKTAVCTYSGYHQDPLFGFDIPCFKREVLGSAVREDRKWQEGKRRRHFRLWSGGTQAMAHRYDTRFLSP